VRVAALLATVALAVGGCGTDEAATTVESATTTVESATTTAVSPDGGCADVIAAEASLQSDGTYTFQVTVSSADTGPDKYADLWEVRAPDGAVLGTRILTHSHEGEQPFTRSQSGISIPEGISEVIVAARDTVAGFCGDTVTVQV